jgi:folate-dependent phosphoribosylglycinamide formyltransferase PurN
MLQAQGWSVLGVFTDAATVREWAEAQQCPVWSVEALDAITAELSFDWLFSITHLRIVPSGVLKRARCGAVNFHDGPLPKYGGLNAPLWALLAGERYHGISWHRMTDAVDAGEVLVQQTFPIGDTDTALSLNARCWEAALESFPQLLERLSTLPPVTSSLPPDDATFHRGADRPSGIGLLDPSRSCADWTGSRSPRSKRRSRILQRAGCGCWASLLCKPGPAIQLVRTRNLSSRCSA